MCEVKCEVCEESGGKGCDCPDLIWEVCPECEEAYRQDWEDEQCSCDLDEIDIHCRWCFG